MVLYMAKEKASKKSLKVYDLFGKEKDKSYCAIHTLNRLYLNNVESLRQIKPYLSDFSIHPYLMLQQLSEDKANELVGLIFNDITKNLFPEKKFTPEIIRRIENPSRDKPFMENLVYTMTREKRDERFQESSKAKELFYSFAEKRHLRLLVDQLETFSRLYHRLNDNGGGLDCTDP
jgi:hypothetical protein